MDGKVHLNQNDSEKYTAAFEHNGETTKIDGEYETPAEALLAAFENETVKVVHNGTADNVYAIDHTHGVKAKVEDGGIEIVNSPSDGTGQAANTNTGEGSTDGADATSDTGRTSRTR